MIITTLVKKNETEFDFTIKSKYKNFNEIALPWHGPGTRNNVLLKIFIHKNYFKKGKYGTRYFQEISNLLNNFSSSPLTSVSNEVSYYLEYPHG